jgi:H+/gluconate symporter-like permease
MPTPIVPPVDCASKWAVVNLILSVVGVVLAVVASLCVLMFKKKKDTAKIEQKNTNKKTFRSNYQSHDDEADVKKVVQSRLFWLVTAVVFAVVGIVVFLLTEDTSLSMGWVDKWTIVNAVLLIVESVAILFVFKQTKVKSKQKQTTTSNINNKSQQ